MTTRAPVREGDVLAGKYRVDRVLGVGGMGVVVAAHHMQLDERVAIKFMLPEALANAEAVARFDREARAAVKIKSEHVARVIDVGRLENGAPYMVMEFLEGGDLSAWLEQRGSLPVEQAAEFVLQACEAIAEAHALGIVHRDLKPANLFCLRRADGLESVKVLDFGISKVTGIGGSDMGMTRTAAIVGSPLYMSPEQMQSSRGVDARADIWSLGVILYELVSGRVPFEAEAITELVLKIVSAPPGPLRAGRPDVPEGFERVVLRCLEKSRDNRYANVGELAMALAEFAPRRAQHSVERITRVLQAAGVGSVALVAAPAAAAGTAQGPMTTAASWGRTGNETPAPTTHGRAVATVLAAVLLVAAGAGTALMLSRKTAPASHPDPAAAAAVPPPPPASMLAVAAPAPSAASPPASESIAPAPPPPTTSVAPATPSTARRSPSPPSTAATPQPPSHAAKDCDPPYSIDSAGRRQYKPECF